MILHWTGPARDDLTGIVEFIAEDNAVAALAVIDRIDEAAQHVRATGISRRHSVVS